MDKGQYLSLVIVLLITFLIPYYSQGIVTVYIIYKEATPTFTKSAARNIIAATRAAVCSTFYTTAHHSEFLGYWVLSLSWYHEIINYFTTIMELGQGAPIEV